MSNIGIFVRIQYHLMSIGLMNIKHLIFDIEQRPALYISKNYLSCLKAFLDGYLFANNNLNGAFILNDFNEFIKEKYHITSSQSWADIIIFFSTDEHDALNNFFLLFHKFIDKQSIVES